MSKKVKKSATTPTTPTTTTTTTTTTPQTTASADISKLKSRRGQGERGNCVRTWVYDQVKKDPTQPNSKLREKAIKHWGETRGLVKHFSVLFRWVRMQLEEDGEKATVKKLLERPKEPRAKRTPSTATKTTKTLKKKKIAPKKKKVAKKATAKTPKKKKAKKAKKSA